MADDVFRSSDAYMPVIYICPKCKRLGAIRVEIVICNGCGYKEIK